MRRPQIVTTDQIYKSQAHVKLVCGFYGPTHPKCKQAVDNDTTLYMSFLKQFDTTTDVTQSSDTHQDSQ